MGITRTKIICTIGPATKDLAVLRKLYKAGMNVVRINMSHADHVFAKNIIDKVKKILGMDITIVTTANTNEEGMALLEEFGFPFAKKIPVMSMLKHRDSQNHFL